MLKNLLLSFVIGLSLMVLLLPFANAVDLVPLDQKQQFVTDGPCDWHFSPPNPACFEHPDTPNATPQHSVPEPNALTLVLLGLGIISLALLAKSNGKRFPLFFAAVLIGYVIGLPIGLFIAT